MMAMLLCVAVVATLSSCSRDNEDLIIGKWKIVKDTYTVIANGMVIENPNDAVGEIWEFKTDGTVAVTYHYYNEVTYRHFDETEINTYTVSGNTLLIMGGIIRYPITTLNKSKMVWEYDSYDDVLDDGEYNAYDVKIRTELKKI